MAWITMQDGRTLGDQWLEAKGKAKPPGPEMRRGRQGLAETLQQGSNPYQVRLIRPMRGLGWHEYAGERSSRPSGRATI